MIFGGNSIGTPTEGFDNNKMHLKTINPQKTESVGTLTVLVKRSNHTYLYRIGYHSF